MFDLQSIIKTSNNISFGDFVQNVANSNPQIGRGFMGNVSFISGLPNGLTKGTMTVISYGEGFIKFSLDVENTPNHYECYRLSDGTITDWTIGQGGGGEVDLMQEVTYSELKNLRDNGELIPGLSYRITDYDCMTFQKNTRSAHNQFDVIVTADSSNALNENARAINHVFKSEGDTNVTYITLRFGSDHQLYFTYNGEKVWAFLYDEDDDTYIWSSQIGDVTSKKAEVYNPSQIYYDGERIYVDGYNDMHINIMSVELRGQYTGKTTVIDDEEYYVFDLGKSNVAMSLEDIDYDGNPIYVERDKPFEIYKNLLYFKSLEPTIDDIYFYYNSSNFLPFSEYVDMWEQIYAEPLYFEYSVNNTVEPIVVDDYFAESNLSAWKLKYALDDKENHYAWIHSVDGYGDGLEFSVAVNIGNNRRGAKAASDSDEETVTITASRVNDNDYYGRWNGLQFIELCKEWEVFYGRKIDETEWYSHTLKYFADKGLDSKKARLYGYKVNINDLPEDIHPSIFAPVTNKSIDDGFNKEKGDDNLEREDTNKDDGLMISHEHNYCYTFLPPEEITSGLYTLSVDDIVWRFDAQNEYAITEVNKKGGNNNPFSKLNNTLHNLHRNGEQENDRKVNTKKNDRKLADRFTERMANKQKNDKPQHKLFSIFSNSQFKETWPLVNNTKSDRREVDDSLAEADPSLTTFEFITDSIGDVIEEETFEYTETRADDNIRGVIYYMKDEFGNECPYDFKNIQFKRTFTYYAYHNGNNDIVDDIAEDLNYYLNNYSIVTVITRKNESYPYSFSYYEGDGEIDFYDFGEEFDEYFYAYTFSRLETYDAEGEEVAFDDLFDVFDATLKIFANYYEDDEYYENNVSNNIIKPCYQLSDYTNYNNCVLNNITFVSVYPELSCNNNVFDYNCYDINFGDESYSNKIGSGCHCNSFLNECSDVTLGDYCSDNLFGFETYNISFKNNCSNNLIDSYCCDISFGYECDENFIGQQTYYITTGDDFKYNLMGATCDIIFGHYCQNNELYDWCDGNTFGNNCFSNIIGSDCCNNSFGNGCNEIELSGGSYDNSFGNSCSGIVFNYECESTHFSDYCYDLVFDTSLHYCTFGNNVKSLYITSDNPLVDKTTNWVFDNGVFLNNETTPQLALPVDDDTTSKRVIKTSDDGGEKIYAIMEYVVSGNVLQKATCLYPPNLASISYNSPSQITGDWVDANTDSSQNTYDSNTGDGTLYLNNGVDEIGGEGTREGLRAPLINSPFFMNTDVRSVDMSNSGLITIGDHAFDGCTNLANTVIPNSVTKIGVNAFADCPLNSVDIPDSVTEIGADAFKNGTTNVNYNGSASGSPWGAQYVNADTDDNSGLMFGNFDAKTYTCAVVGCIPTSIKTIAIPSTVDYEKNTYTVVRIEAEAFRNCTNITYITIPATITSLGGKIFDGCYTLSTDGKTKVSTIKTVNELSSTVPTINTETFDAEIIIPTLYIPTNDAIPVYTKTWGKYFDNIMIFPKSGENGLEER